ncbi:hypothetical protein Tco_0622740 [Tanacetum coccineum]
MTTLQFADTHNLVAFLSKPAESEGFEQIVDFLNANPIKYALTINPTIYTSCIEQFWATVKVKTINGEVQLQALVYGKKITVTKASVRRDLQLNDEEGTNCLPNATIFEELTRMGYKKLSHKLTFYKAFFSPQWEFLIHTILQYLSAKTTAWNEFSSTMASAIICLAINQKFNFSKYIFESMVKNLENVSGKFLMYPRFVQVFLDKQLEGMSNHKKIYITPSHTKKIFRNIRKVGKGFSRRETPLFPTMMVQAQEETGEGSANPTDPHHIPTVIQPSTSQPQKKQKPRNPKRKDTEVPQLNGLTDNEEMDDRVNTPRSDEDRLKIKELMELCTNLQNRVIDLEKTKTSQAQEITSLKRRVKRLEKKGGSRTYELKRLYKVGLSRRVKSSDEEGINLVSTHFDGDTNMFRVHDLVDDEVVVEREVDVKAASTIPVSVATTTTTVITDDEITLAKALAELRSAKLPTTTAATTIIAASIRPKAKELVIHEHEQAPTPTVSSQQKLQLNVQDKGKGKMVELDPVKTLSKKDQLMLNEELAFKLQDELEEEDMLVRQREEEANIVSWDNVQAMIDADYQMAQQMQAK